MKKTRLNKFGFTLIESVCVIAIIVMLSTVIIVAVGDHIKNAKKASAILENHNTQLAAVDDYVYGTAHYERSADADVIGRNITLGGGGTNTSGGGSSTTTSGGGAGGGGAEGLPIPAGAAEIKDDDTVAGEDMITTDEDFSSEDNVIPESDGAAEVPEEPEMDSREMTVASVAASISSYASQHQVEYIEGTENLPQIIAEAEVSAMELYEEGGYTGPRYFTYCPATGVTALANGNGTYMQQDIGQNLLKAYLKDAAAVATEGSNVRGRLDSAFLADSSRYIYIGVNQLEDGSVQVVPNLCVDTLGNFNTVITFRYNNSTTDRVTCNANAGWNSYVNYVTNRSGEMLDTSVLDTSAYTATSSAAHDNPIWLAAVNDLRNSY